MHTISQSVVVRRNSSRRLVHLALALALPLAACCSVQAQQPDGDYEGDHTYKQPDGKVVDLTEPKKAKSKIGGILRTGKATSAEEEKHFSDFFRYRLAEMTWKENVTSLPDMRKKLKNYLAQAGRGSAPDLHVRLNKWILEDFQKVAEDARYPRAIRLNCVLMIGDLDQREAAIGSGPAEIPLPEAERVLFSLFSDENQHAALRIEALRGLMRHAEHDLTADQRTELLAAAVKLIKAKEPPKGKSAIGHLWLRMLSCATVSILSGKGAEANQPGVVDALQSLIGDKSAPLWLRCYSANTFGSLQAKAFGEDKVLPLAQQLAGLVVEVAQTNDRLMEEAGVDAKKKAKTAPKPPVPGANEEEAAESDRPAIPESLLKVAADDVAADLIYVYRGLTGADLNERNAQPSQTHALFGAAGQDAKTFVTDLAKRIDGMLNKLKDPKKELHEQLADISTDGGELQAWLKEQGVSLEPKPENVVKPSGAKPATRPAPGAAVGQPAGNSSAAESAVNR